MLDYLIRLLSSILLFFNVQKNKREPEKIINDTKVEHTLIVEDISNENFQLFINASINQAEFFIAKETRKMLKNKVEYVSVASELNMPWWIVAVIHALESNQDFTKHLHNGDSLDAKTFNVPKGRPLGAFEGPFDWKLSAIDALRMSGADKIKLWSIDIALDFLEKYNGLGYRKLNINSPYLWSFTNKYTKGKYVRDGVFKYNAVSKQVGGVAYIIELLNQVTYLEAINTQFVAHQSKPLPIETNKNGLMILDVARKELGQKEVTGYKDNPRIMQYLKSVGEFKHDEVPWCAAFLNWCFNQVGLRGSKSAVARSFLRVGVEVKVEDALEGDIAVFWRESKNSYKGHVFIITSVIYNFDGSKIVSLEGIGGNQHDQVSYDRRSVSKLLSVRRV